MFRKNFIMPLLENILILLITAVVFYISQSLKTEKTIYIPQGSITNIISQLHKKGYEVSVIDRYILTFLGQPQSGWVDIGAEKLNRIDFLYQLATAKAKMEEITLIPGETTVLFFEDIAVTLDLNASRLQHHYDQNADYPEAAIYADTYYVPFGINEEQLVAFLLKESTSQFQKISRKIYGTYDEKQWLRILTIASIIQKEAANTEEMPLVSSVIYNRLKKGMPLQMDGTLNYGKYSHTKVTPERIRNDKSRFNTYKYKGLPPSPIGAVGFDAIIAAIKPVQTDYLYFMKNKQGTHDFTKSYHRHRRNIEKAK
ncbi:endolytic transglycosylase MltG [Sulfurovum sp.]|uniref:endolytic transglycosylase MltG n=1 Tax=Sulfurovum sp. TaxID=1969726 RepID=UPI002A367700|nr:endolytic transglycosylase MltG [Sulfurovum sp.]MDD2451401.1 endolytic transglycosylase MltG [Sulfurovum sp.]MDD3500651.1 endolytic transglycosylase MltG [Sulfurovum sp.]MDY0402971.1 endolytic transglycosylase MltG [Sulfurovum sp.]